jgi:hypothetical protein
MTGLQKEILKKINDLSIDAKEKSKLASMIVEFGAEAYAEGYEDAKENAY